MESGSADVAAGLAGALGLAALILAPVIAGALALRASASARVGSPLHRSPRSRPRYAELVLLALLAILVVLVGDAPTASALTVLALAALLLLASPTADEGVLGEQGVRSGWHAARYGELDEWRLTGEHLRWRLGPTWRSVPLPPESHAGLRARLAELAPGRESKFQH